MYSENPNERPDIPTALNELSKIENEINNIQIDNSEYISNNNIDNINNNINRYINYNNINYNNMNSHVTINNKIISSMKCILQFFCKVDNMNFIKVMVLNNIKNANNINNYFPYLLINILDKIEKYNNNQMNNNDYNICKQINLFVKQNNKNDKFYL